jgi:hypothetical protein
MWGCVGNVLRPRFPPGRLGCFLATIEVELYVVHMMSHHLSTRALVFHLVGHIHSITNHTDLRSTLTCATPSWGVASLRPILGYRD